MGRLSRNKGKRGELELVSLLRDRYGVPARRTSPLQAGDPRAAGDVWIHDQLWLETKRGKQPRIRAALAQAEADCGERVPVAITRADRDQWIVTMGLDDWIDLYLAWRETDETAMRQTNKG